MHIYYPISGASKDENVQLKHPVYDILCWQPEQTNTLMIQLQ